MTSNNERPSLTIRVTISAFSTPPHSQSWPCGLHPPFPSAPASVPAQRGMKRQASSDFETSLSKKQQQNLCFRCGLLGHLPADCNSTTTAAGKAPAPLARGAKSIHSLAAPDGRQFCFNFATSSLCAFGPTCTNFHGCSIYGAPSHGAGKCRSVE
jgi:hypothetical protein